MKKVLLLILSLFVSPAFASGIGASSASAPCTNNTLETYSGNTNLQADWQPNTINLNWYNGDTKLTVQSSAQSCVYDGTLTIPSTQPTRTGYTFAGWEVRLPGAYTELEYIEGGQDLNAYIDLGFPATPTMQTLLTASISIESTITTGNQQVIFGASDKFNYSDGKPYSIDRYPPYMLLPNGNFDWSTDKVDFDALLNVVYHFKVNYPTVGLIGVNDTLKTGFINITSVSSKNLYLFGFNGNGSYSTEFSVLKMKFYALTLWDNSILIHNYIPVKRNSDNVIGIYDTITHTFLTNAGTGTFVAGPVVQ